MHFSKLDFGILIRQISNQIYHLIEAPNNRDFLFACDSEIYDYLSMLEPNEALVPASQPPHSFFLNSRL